MSTDFIDDLLKAVFRIFPIDISALKEILIISGMPEETQNLRYLSFNRQTIQENATIKTFSAVALINNRRATQWLLKGYARKISQLVFSPRWTRNEMDLFINALRCSPDILALISSSPAAYSLLGVLEIEDHGNPGVFKRWSRRVRPALVIPGLNEIGHQKIAEFEHVNEVRKYSRKKTYYKDSA
jgi:hypothetical protein